MYKNKKIIGIIPARAGSKRCYKKNIRLLGQKPLISWTIEHAQKSRYLDGVVVTSDDPEIKIICERVGVKFIDRPAVLASDNAASSDVVMHTLENIENEYSYFVLLQPTSPFRDDKDIDEAIERCLNSKAKSCVSFVESPYKENLLYLDKATNLEVVKDKLLMLNGAIYMAEIKNFIRSREFIDQLTVPYVMSASRSIDIDTEDDFNKALNLIGDMQYANAS